MFRLIAGQSHSEPLRYPERLGRWPAVAGIVGFAWLELVYETSGLGAVGLQPATLAAATLVYTAYTLVAMALFGVETWLRRGEAFSVYFGMFSQLAPLEVRDGRLGVRRPLAAATHWAKEVPGSIALVVATIASTTFDGAQEGLWQQPVRDLFDRLTDLGLGPTAAFRTSESIFFALTLAGVAAIYWAGVRGMRTVRGSPALRSLGRSFAHTLIPIGVAYLAAHYFSLFVFAEQAQFTYLLSDPLGDGSDLFGTASSGIDYGLLSANTIWYVQVAALVTGHVVGLMLAHDRAITVYGTPTAPRGPSGGCCSLWSPSPAWACSSSRRPTPDAPPPRARRPLVLLAALRAAGADRALVGDRHHAPRAAVEQGGGKKAQ